jgi:choline dehydrogenase-like flavoprotein
MQGQAALISTAGRNLPWDEMRKLELESGRTDLAVIGWFGPKEIQRRDAVEFSESASDYYGMPAMRIRYKLTAGDRQAIETMRANANRLAHIVGEPIYEPKLAAGGSSLHYQGTTRMGPVNDGTSVCDAFSRVWGVKNLYVGGNGVIPTATAGNPTITSVALAARAARQMVSTF